MPKFEAGDTAIVNNQPVTILHWPDDETAGAMSYHYFDAQGGEHRGNYFLNQVTIQSPAELAAAASGELPEPVDYSSIVQTVDPELAGLLDDDEPESSDLSVDDEEKEEEA
jgi:hypothetical protein